MTTLLDHDAQREVSPRMTATHEPVLVDAVVDLLAVTRGPAIIVDASKESRKTRFCM